MMRPFLCNSCGFSKYARFELIAEVRSCSAVDPVDSEEDRQKVSCLLCACIGYSDIVYLFRHCLISIIYWRRLMVSTSSW